MSVDALASAMTSPVSRAVLRLLRMDDSLSPGVVSKGHQRGAGTPPGESAYAMCPDILNDPEALPGRWTSSQKGWDLC